MTKDEIEKGIEKVLSSVDKGDVIVGYSESAPIDFDMDKLKSIEDINRFSMGLRIFKTMSDKRVKVGYSYINSLNDIDSLIKNANESAELGDIMDLDLPSDNGYADLKLYDDDLQKVTKEDCVGLGEKLLKRLKSIDSEAKVSVGVGRSVAMHWVANTAGFHGYYPETRFSVSANMTHVEDNGSLLMVGDGDSSNDVYIDTDSMVENIEWRYTHARKSAKVKSGYFPVLFTPDALGLLLEAIEIAANGNTLYKGVSVLENRIGEAVIDPRLSIIDDPFYKRGTDNYPFDDEGVVPKALPIIENGVFKNFIFDMTTAKRLGKRTTGHGRRNAAIPPAPAFSNLILSVGDDELKSMIRSIDYGLIVCDFLGGGMSNILAGDFSVNIELGYLVENGVIRGRVKDAMMSGNAYDVLKSVAKMENKLHKVGSLYAPHVLFDKVSVAGNV